MDERRIGAKRQNEKMVVSLMIRLYCKGNHGTKRGEICDECKELTDYSIARVERCPHMGTKSFCTNCKTRCFKPEMRERLRTVMRWSGPRMLFSHPVMAVRHLVETRSERKGLA